jgi:hypothetical protein
VPFLEEFADACVRLYDINVITTHLHACVGLEVRIMYLWRKEFEVACFNIGPPGLSSGTERLALTAVFVEFFFLSLAVTDSTLSLT